MKSRHCIRHFHNAAKDKCLSKIKMYLDKGADVNSLNAKGETIFHVAVQQNDMDTVQYLINRYSTADETKNKDLNNSILNANAKNMFGETVLHLAVKYNNKDLIVLLFKSNLRVNETTHKGLTALHYAVETQTVERTSILLTELLVKFNAKIDVKNKKGETPLHLAVKLNKYALTKWFLSMGANVNNKTKFSFTPIFEAVRNGNVRMVKLLLQNGANVNVINNLEDNPLLYAIKILPEGKSQVDITLLLLKAGIEINHQNYTKSSALILAIHKQNEALVRLLISNNCCVNIRNQTDRTPLYLAIHHHMTDIVELLLTKGADANATVNRNLISQVSPLYCAVERGNLQAVNLLLEHGANPNSKLPGSRTPLNVALLLGFENIALRLLKGGADVNLRDSYGDAPLHMVTIFCEFRSKYESLMQQLLYLGAEVCVRNRNGCTPLGLLEGENKETLRFGFILVRHMALRRFQNLVIGIKNVQLIARSVPYAERFTDCMKELANMQETKIAGDVSFYDLLVTRSHKLVQWVGIEEIVDQIEEEIWRLRFRYYNDMIVANYRAARKRLDLLQKGSVALIRVTGIRLPLEIANIVCRMLGNDDLANLELAKQRRAGSTAPTKFTMSLRKRRKI